MKIKYEDGSGKLRAQRKWKSFEKNIFSKFWGVSGPLNPPIFRFLGVLGGPKTPQNFEKKFFSKFYHFLWPLNFPEPSSYLIFNFRKYFSFFFENFHIFWARFILWNGPENSFSCYIRFKLARDFLKAVLESECKKI